MPVYDKRRTPDEYMEEDEELEDEDYEEEIEESEPDVDWDVTGNADESVGEEMMLQSQIDELEEKAKAREKRMEQKARVRALKKRVRKAQVKETFAPVGETFEPVITTGKKLAEFGKQTGKGFIRMGKAMGGKRSTEDSVSMDEMGSQPSSKKGFSLGFGDKVGLSVSEGKEPLAMGKTRPPETSSVLSKGKTQYDFSLGRRGLFSSDKKESSLGMVMGRRNEYDFSLGRGSRQPVKRRKSSKRKPVKKPVKKSVRRPVKKSKKKKRRKK